MNHGLLYVKMNQMWFGNINQEIKLSEGIIITFLVGVKKEYLTTHSANV